MSRYTKEQIDRAKEVDLVSYLQSQGYQLVREGSEYKLAEHDSLYIRGNQWHWFSQDKGGKTLDFLTDYEGKSFTEAMQLLVGEPAGIDSRQSGSSRGKQPDRRKTEERFPPASPADMRTSKELILPEPAPDNEAAFRYLKNRGIDTRLISKCMEEGTIYQTNMFMTQNESGEYEKVPCPPAVVFVGRDEQGVARYACTRSTAGPEKFDAVGSDKSYAFMLPEDGSRSVYVFESAIDALSHKTMSNYFKKHYSAHRISLGGLSPNALMRFLDTHPDVIFINLALDNDPQGRKATESIKSLLEERFASQPDKGYRIYDHPAAFGKDANEELLIRQQQYREYKKAQQGLLYNDQAR